MAHQLQDDINALLQLFEQQDGHQPMEPLPAEDGKSWENEAEGAITETIHVYFVRESELEEPADEQVVESTLATSEDRLPRTAIAHESQQAHTRALPEMAAPRPVLGTRTRASLARWAVGVAIVLPLLSIAFQVILLLLNPTATITLAPVVRDLSLTTNMMAIEPGTATREQIPASRLAPLTLTQSKTVPATGKGHQVAEAAMGTITFYNGLFTSQTIAAGTTLTGSDGVQVSTDQLAVVPAALATTPPTYGQVTVSAHAIEPGPQGNIPVHDINQVCCLPSVLVQNTVAFQGGQNERDYTVVTWEDINHGVASLIPTLKQSEHAAFAAQLRAHEALAAPPCTRNVTADHHAGAEAAAVTITVSEKCTAITYDAPALREQATQVLTHELVQREGPHYRLVGAVQASLLHARIIDQGREVAGLTVQIKGTSVYQFSQQQLQRIQQLVAGKTPSQAERILLGLPGVQRATIAGIEANRSLPKDYSHIQVRMLYRELLLSNQQAVIGS